MEPAERNAIAQANWDAYQRALNAGHDEYVKMATKCDAFYRGEQWAKEDQQALEAEGRPALTINAVKSAVNTVLGQYAEQRMDISYKARHGGFADSAEALTKLASQIQDNNKYADVEGTVFADGLIQDRGYFDIRIDFSDSMRGEVRITSEDPIDVLPDPTAKDYDPRTWNEVTKTRWMTVDEIALHYGKKKAQEVEAVVGNESSYGQDSVRYHQQTYGDVDLYTTNTDDRKIRRVRVLERQYYKLRSAKCFVDMDTGDMRDVPENWDDAKVDEFSKKFGLAVQRKIKRSVRWCVTADHVVLHDAWSPYKHFTIVPFFPFFRRGRPTGMVRDLLSAQEQLNKVESQQLHIVNTTANSGWVLEAGSLTNMTLNELEERGAETGVVIEYARGRTAPTKIQPNQVPSGLDRFGAKALSHLREISGVNSLLGLEGDEVSGVALQQKQSRGITQLQVPFDNLRRTRQIMAELMLELVQQYYTETRVFRVTNFAALEQADEEVVINAMDAAGRVINDITAGEYDVVVSAQPARDTFAETQFAEALNLRNAGVAIPDHWVIQYSNLSDKNAVAQEVRELTGMGEPTEEEMQMAQLQQQMAVQSAQLELEKMAAEIQDLQADVQLKQAKAQSEVGELQLAAQQQQIDAQLRLGNMQSEFTKKMADYQNKLQLAQIHTAAKRSDSLHANATKRMIEEMKAKTTGLAAPQQQEQQK